MGAVTAAVVGGTIAAGGSIAAGRQARKGAKEQMAAANRAAQVFEGIQLPSIEEQRLILQTPELMGQYTPEQVEAMQDMTSSMSNVSADEGTIAAQEAALKGISEVAEGGFTEGDKSAAREVQRTVSQDAQARQKAILNSMAQRGTLGSGMELAAQLQSAEQAADQMSRGGENLTQQAQARALQALGQQGSLAGQMRGQQFGEQSDIARAQDEIGRFNAANRQSIQQANIAERNRAQLINLQQKQAQEDQRAALANQQQMHNKALQQQQFQNQMQRASGLAGQYQAQGQAAANAANIRAGQVAGIASGIGNAIGGIGSYYQNQQNAANAQKLAETMAINRTGTQTMLPAYNDPFDPNKING